jgi:hypothetical protein
MTKRLEEAFAAAAKLPAREQEALAEWVLEELSGEHQWMQTFAGSQEALSRLSDEAKAEHRAGQTHLLDPERL